jgi:hypothetical protein
MSLVLRFIDSEFNIREQFFRFIHCSEGLAGKDLAAVILRCLSEELCLDIQDCRGQGYDGAGAVAGHINGLAARIKRLNNKAIYTHCYSHRLNLSILGSCSVQCVKNALEQVKEVANFFNSSDTRQLMLESNISSYCSDSLKKRLKSACKTRWVERIESLDTFEELFVAIAMTLEEMELNLEKKCNGETSSKAGSLFRTLSSFDFIACLVITRCFFDLTLPVTQLLQFSSNDIADGLHLVESLKNLVMLIRNGVDNYHAKWYKLALELAAKINIDESKPRTRNSQIHRSNIPSDSIFDYYKKSITIPMADHLNFELASRFDESSTNVYNGLYIIPAKLVSYSSNSNSGGTCWKDKFSLFASMFSDDLPNPIALDGELYLWESFWKSNDKGSLPDNVSATLKAINFPGFENIKVLLRILGTIPVTSCECERSFSALRRLKDYTRSTMAAACLNGLALLYIHQDLELDVEKVIDMIAKDRRRIELAF